MQNHSTLKLDITLLLENDKRTRLYLPNPNPYMVYSKKGNMIVATRYGHTITRKS